MPPQTRDMSGHDQNLTVEEVSALFSDAGIPRSPRTIRRYCRAGHLKCTLVDTDINEKYLVDRDSVSERIVELKQVVKSGQDQTSPVTSGQDQTGPDIANEKKEELEKKIETLEYENLNLKIDNRAKEGMITHFATERKEMLQNLTTQAHLIGGLENKLLLLETRKTETPQKEEPTYQDEEREHIIPASSENGDNRTPEGTRHVL